jgi:hypothetical protein
VKSLLKKKEPSRKDAESQRLRKKNSLRVLGGFGFLCRAFGFCRRIAEVKQSWKIFFIGTVIFFATAGESLAQESEAAPVDTTISQPADSLRKVKNPTGAMLRSIAFPGWGQWYNGRRFKAVIVFGAEAGIIANTVYQNQMVQKSQSDLEREFYLENRRLSNWWLAGAILLSMIDAYVDAHLYDFDEGPELGAVSASARPNDVVWLWRAQIKL